MTTGTGAVGLQDHLAMDGSVTVVLGRGMELVGGWCSWIAVERSSRCMGTSEHLRKVSSRRRSGRTGST